ncbi:TonB-dependent receptor plug domain-containing protein [Caulobacter segnis]
MAGQAVAAPRRGRPRCGQGRARAHLRRGSRRHRPGAGPRRCSLCRWPCPAATGEALAKQGVKNIIDLAAQAPSLQISSGSGGSAQVFMRGVGSTKRTTVVGDPAVAVHVDGIYVSPHQRGQRPVLRPGPGRGGARPAGDTARPQRHGRGDQHHHQHAQARLPGRAGRRGRQLRGPLTTLGHGQRAAGRDPGRARGVPDQPSRRPSGRAVNKAPGTGGNDAATTRTTPRTACRFSTSRPRKLKVPARGDYLHRGGAGFVDVAHPLETGDPYSANAKVNTSQERREFRATSRWRPACGLRAGRP